MLKTSKRHL